MVSYLNMQARVPSTSLRSSAPRDKRLDLILQALSHQTRRALLARLATGPAIVRELAEPFSVTRVAISKHLRILEQAHLVTRTVDGRVHQCAISPEPLRELEEWLVEYRLFWSSNLKALARYVARPDGRRRNTRSAS